MRKAPTAAALALGVMGAFAVAQGCAVEPTSNDIATVSQALEDENEDENENECNTAAGVKPVMAALAVAMASEMGELKPLEYFAWDPTAISQWEGMLVLSSAGESRCNAMGGCPNLKSILALQGKNVNANITQAVVNEYNADIPSDCVKQVPLEEGGFEDVPCQMQGDQLWDLPIDQNVLNTTQLRDELRVSLERQQNHDENLVRNEPWKLPEPHQLSLIGTLDRGACGLHYEFAATKPGTNDLLDHPENLVNNLVFFGVLANNEFIAFYSTEAEIGIDPTVGLNTTLQESGTCGYGFTVYDPTWWSYGKCCVYANRYGVWRVAPWAVNTFYCKTY